MKISVICPTYNSENFVENTLTSVINQSFLPDEIILIDDGSTDNTIQVLESFKKEYKRNIRIQILKSNHNGPGKARNIGIKNANNEWIAFLDSDDIWHANKLERIHDIFKENEETNFFMDSQLAVFLACFLSKLFHNGYLRECRLRWRSS